MPKKKPTRPTLSERAAAANVLAAPTETPSEDNQKVQAERFVSVILGEPITLPKASADGSYRFTRDKISFRLRPNMQPSGPEMALFVITDDGEHQISSLEDLGMVLHG